MGRVLGGALGGGRRAGQPHVVATAEDGPAVLLWALGSGDEAYAESRLTFLAARTVWQRAGEARGEGFKERTGFEVRHGVTMFHAESGPGALEDLRALAVALREAPAPPGPALGRWIRDEAGAPAHLEYTLGFMQAGRRGPGIESGEAMLAGKLTPVDVSGWLRQHTQAHRVGLAVPATSVTDARAVVASWGEWEEAEDAGTDWRAEREAAGRPPGRRDAPPMPWANGNARQAGEGWGLSLLFECGPEAEDAASFFISAVLRRLGQLPVLASAPSAEALELPEQQGGFDRASITSTALEHFDLLRITHGRVSVDPLEARDAILDVLRDLPDLAEDATLRAEAAEVERAAYEEAVESGWRPVAELRTTMDPRLPPNGTGSWSLPTREALEQFSGLGMMTSLFAVGEAALAAALKRNAGGIAHPLMWWDEERWLGPLEGKHYKRQVFSLAPKGYEAWDDGESLVIGGCGGGWDEIVAVVDGGNAESWVLFLDGASALLKPSWLKGGHELVTEVRRRVPSERIVLASELPWTEPGEQPG